MAEYRRPIILVGAPPTFFETHDPNEADLASEVFAAQWRYVHGRATEHDLAPYQGLSLAGQVVETDPDALEEWARRGEFDLAEVYREMFG